MESQNRISSVGSVVRTDLLITIPLRLCVSVFDFVNFFVELMENGSAEETKTDPVESNEKIVDQSFQSLLGFIILFPNFD